MIANPTTGASGYRLMSGFDVKGGIQVDNSYLGTAIHRNKPDNRNWRITYLNKLLNSDRGSLNLLVSEIIAEGFDLYDQCEYTHTKSSHFIKIKEKLYTISGTTILRKPL